MRLFLALLPPEPVVAHLREAVDHVRRRRPQDSVRWVDPIRWHVTLVFIGEVDDTVVEQALPVLTDVMAACEPPSIQLWSTGMFNGSVLHTQVVAPDAEDREPRLDVLALRAQEVLQSIDIHVDDRPFQPHLTLARPARGRRDPTGELARSAAALHAYRGPAWTADEVTLVQSVKSVEGATYSTMATTLVGPGR